MMHGGSCTSQCVPGPGSLRRDSVDQPQVDFIQPLHAPKTWRTLKAVRGLQPKREGIPSNNDTTLTKLRFAHYGYFLYLLLGKSHFKDLCYLKAKLFFFLSTECSFLLFHHEE